MDNIQEQTIHSKDLIERLKITKQTLTALNRLGVFKPIVLKANKYLYPLDQLERFESFIASQK